MIGLVENTSEDDDVRNPFDESTVFVEGHYSVGANICAEQCGEFPMTMTGDRARKIATYRVDGYERRHPS